MIQLPFTPDQFQELFAAYNLALWPVQVVIWVFALVITLASAFTKGRVDGRTMLWFLAAMWAWSGIAYHGLYFSAINPAAYGFAAAFLLQALCFCALALTSPAISFRAGRGVWHGLGLAFVFYGLIAYPATGLLSAHPYATPAFGVTPCPTLIFTLGVMLLSQPRLPAWLFAIPILWSAVGGSAAMLLDMPQDAMLLPAGVVAAVFALARGSRRPIPH